MNDLYTRLPLELRKDLAESTQDPIWHPEIFVSAHILQVLQRAINYFPDDIDMQIAAVFHDLGKPETRTVEIKNGVERIHNFGHEALADKFIDKYIHLYSDLNPNVDKIRAICKQHMCAHKYLDGTIKKPSKRKAFESQPFAQDIINFSKFCDHGI